MVFVKNVDTTGKLRAVHAAAVSTDGDSALATKESALSSLMLIN